MKSKLTAKSGKAVALITLSINALLPLGVNAFESQKFEDFKTTNVCKYCDLTNAPLAARDMKGADFQNANLSGADLSKADLSPRVMEKRTLNSNFESGNLRKADLRQAKLIGANFSNAYLRETLLDGADLTQANLAGLTQKCIPQGFCAQRCKFGRRQTRRCHFLQHHNARWQHQ